MKNSRVRTSTGAVSECSGWPWWSRSDWRNMRTAIEKITQQESSMSKIQPDKVRDLIQHVRENADALAKKGVDKDALDAHIAKLETEMKKPEPDHGAVSDTLAAIETTVGEAEENMM